MSAPCRLLKVVDKIKILELNNRLLDSTRQFSYITGNEKVDTTLEKATGGRINHWLNLYEDIVGLKDVRDAQGKVIEAETKFMEIQTQRRSKQDELCRIQNRLRSVAADREKTNRVDDSYLKLVTEEHVILRQENDIMMSITMAEKTERECFTRLSAALRESHEKERTRTERTKYWSIIGSFIGVTVGVVGSTLNKHFQMKELRRVINETNAHSAEYMTLSGQILASVRDQNTFVENALEKMHDLDQNDESSGTVGGGGKILDHLLHEIRQNHILLQSQIQDICKMIQISTGDKVSDKYNVIKHGDRKKMNATDDSYIENLVTESDEMSIYRRGEYIKEWTSNELIETTAWIFLGVAWLIKKFI